mmetsp:Transcript_27522/g.70065  ORF Transcript_27522/g.70065 Transcript_27522/m.70065 type:complete len:548 (-) Transcript_27522:561-2204(-)
MGEAAKGSGLVLKLKVKLGGAVTNGARKRQLLVGFPEPGAPASKIVEFFKQDAIPGPTVRPWDDSLVLQHPAPSTRAPEDSARPTKKVRTASTQECAKQSTISKPVLDAGRSCQATGALHAAGPDAVTGAKGHIPAACEEVHNAPGSSSSDHATTSVFNQNPSPAEVQTAPVAVPQPVQVKAETRPAANMRRCDGCSTSTQAGSGAILPTSLLQLHGASDVGEVFSSVGHSAMGVQLRPLIQQAYTLKDSDIEEMMENAKKVKREGDASRKGSHMLWTPHAVSLYLESSLLFMEACEAMLRQPRTSERINKAAMVLVQTAELLQFTIRACESMGKGAELVREVTRVLCERLAACCFIREASCQTHKYTDYAQRVGQLLSRGAPQAAAGTSTAAAAHAAPRAAAPVASAPAGKQAGGKGVPGQQTSPNDSTTSSQEQLAMAQSRGSGAGPGTHARAVVPQNVNVAAELGPLQAKLLTSARQIVKYAELVKRSTNNFQTLLERPDVRHNPMAKLACLHMAALCMDLGMADGGEVLAHAFKVLECIRHLS